VTLEQRQIHPSWRAVDGGRIPGVWIGPCAIAEPQGLAVQIAIAPSKGWTPATRGTRGTWSQAAESGQVTVPESAPSDLLIRPPAGHLLGAPVQASDRPRVPNRLKTLRVHARSCPQREGLRELPSRRSTRGFCLLRESKFWHERHLGERDRHSPVFDERTDAQTVPAAPGRLGFEVQPIGTLDEREWWWCRPPAWPLFDRPSFGTICRSD
jgi:hypothetical protein